MNQHYQKFSEDMLLKYFSVATQKAYTNVVYAFFDESILCRIPEDNVQNICLFIKTASITTKAVSMAKLK